MKPGFYRENRLRILFIVVFLLSFVWMGTRRTFESNSNSVEDWLPDQYAETQDYQWFLKHFPFESFIVASWEGCTLDDDRIELFAQKLVPSQTIDNYSLASPEDEIKADLKIGDAGDLAAHPDAEKEETAPAAENMEKTPAEDAAAQKPSNQYPVLIDEETKTPYFQSVMTGPRLVRILEQTYARTPQSQSEDVIREEILSRLSGTLIGPDKNSTAVIIVLSAGLKGGGKKLQYLLDQVRKISVECGLPDTMVVKTGSIASRMAQNVADVIHEIVYGRSPRTDALILGGPPVSNAALDQEGTRTLFRLAGICAIVSLVLALLCLHDFRLVMFVFWVAILSSGVALALVSFTGGHCDSILLSMPALIYVLAMSGAIHIVNYYHDAIRENGLEGASERAVNHGFTPCFFAQLTTAIGLGSLFSGKLAPITNFGFYSAIGVLMTLLLLFFYLPALLDAFPSKKFAKKHANTGLEGDNSLITRFWGVVGKFLVDHHNAVAVICMIVMCFFGWYLPKIKTSVKMMNFFSPDAEIIAHYTWLEDRLGPLVPMELVICFDNARLNQNLFGTVDRLRLIDYISQSLKEELSEDVGGMMSVAMFTPNLDSNWEPGSLAYRVAASAVAKSISDNRDQLKDYLTIEGNPSVDEIEAFLTEKLAEQQKAYTEAWQELKQTMSDGGEDLAALLPEMTEDDLAASGNVDPSLAEMMMPDKEKIAESSYAASIQELMEDQQKITELASTLRLVQSKKSFLAENELGSLEKMTEHLEQGKSYRELNGDETTQILAACKQWQDERGIELWRISIRVWSLKKEIDYSVFISDVQKVVEPILEETSNDLMAGIDPQAGDIKADFGTGHNNDIIYPAGISAKYTGMVPIVYKTQHALILGLTNSIIMAFFLIAFIFMIILRSVPGGLVAMLPNIFPVIIVFGFMAWLGIEVDVGTMMTASVALGVAVDDTMHYLTWFSDGIVRGKTPKEAAINGYKRCATAMTQSTLIAGLGLSAFMFSTFVPTQRFGVLMLAILFMALVGDLIFLPSLLTGPAGRFFHYKNRKKKSSQIIQAEAAGTDAETIIIEPTVLLNKAESSPIQTEKK